MIKRVWAYTAATILLTQATFSQPSLLRVPSDYRNLDDALHYALAQGGLFTIHLETEGPHTLTRSSYRSLKRSYISLEGPALPYAGRYYGHQVCTFQPGDAVTGQGPYSLTVEGSTITVDPARLEVLGKGTYEGIAPDFSQIVPGIDKLVMYTHTGETTEHDILEAEANTITIQEPIVFSEGDGFTIKPRASIVLAPDHETVTFSIKGSLSFRGIALELNEAQLPHAIFEEVTRLVGCLSWWHCRASEIETSHVVHVGKKAGLELTHTYEGDAQTFLGAGLTVYANNYAQGLHSCFIGCEKAIDAGTYGHAIEKEAEFYNCATGIWADGGSQVAVPGSWLRKCDRGLRLSANSSCMNSASLTMSQVELGIRAMFNSQFHATSLFLDTVSTHAHIDERSLTRLTAPITPGVQTLCPEGYGAYHSGVSYTYLTSTPDETVFRTSEKESVGVTELPDVPVRANKTFLDAIPSEPFVSYNRKKFQMPKQVRRSKKEQQAATRGFRISEKAPCEPCCQKDVSSTDLSDSQIDPTDNKLTEAINIPEEDAQPTEVINMPEEGVQKVEAINTSEEDAQKKERASLSPKKASSLVRGERRRGASPSIYINHSLEGVRNDRPISVRIKNKAIEVTHRTMKWLASLDDLSEGSLIIGIAKDVLIEIPYDSLIEEWRELNQLLDKDLCITIKWRDDVPGDEVTYEFSNVKVRA